MIDCENGADFEKGDIEIGDVEMTVDQRTLVKNGSKKNTETSNSENFEMINNLEGDEENQAGVGRPAAERIFRGPYFPVNTEEETKTQGLPEPPIQNNNRHDNSEPPGRPSIVAFDRLDFLSLPSFHEKDSCCFPYFDEEDSSCCTEDCNWFTKPRNLCHYFGNLINVVKLDKCLAIIENNVHGDSTILEMEIQSGVLYSLLEQTMMGRGCYQEVYGFYEFLGALKNTQVHHSPPPASKKKYSNSKITEYQEFLADKIAQFKASQIGSLTRDNEAYLRYVKNKNGEEQLSLVRNLWKTIRGYLYLAICAERKHFAMKAAQLSLLVAVLATFIGLLLGNIRY